MEGSNDPGPSGNKRLMDVDADYESPQDHKKIKTLQAKGEQVVYDRVVKVVEGKFLEAIEEKDKEVEEIDERLLKVQQALHTLRHYISLNIFAFGSVDKKKQLESPSQLNHPTLLNQRGVTTNFSESLPTSENLSLAVKEESPDGVQLTKGESGIDKNQSEISLSGNISEESKSSIARRVSESKSSPTSEIRQGRKSLFRKRLRVLVGNTYQNLKETGQENSHFNFKWRVYVRGDPEDPPLAESVSHVVFTLDKSYAPHDVITIKEAPFCLCRRGWGEFKLFMKLFFRDKRNKPVQLMHSLTLGRTDDPLAFTGLWRLGKEVWYDVWISDSAGNTESCEPQESRKPVDRDTMISDLLQKGIESKQVFSDQEGNVTLAHFTKSEESFHGVASGNGHTPIEFDGRGLEGPDVDLQSNCDLNPDIKFQHDLSIPMNHESELIDSKMEDLDVFVNHKSESIDSKDRKLVDLDYSKINRSGLNDSKSNESKIWDSMTHESFENSDNRKPKSKLVFLNGKLFVEEPKKLETQKTRDSCGIKNPETHDSLNTNQRKTHNSCDKKQQRTRDSSDNKQPETHDSCDTKQPKRHIFVKKKDGSLVQLNVNFKDSGLGANSLNSPIKQSNQTFSVPLPQNFKIGNIKRISVPNPVLSTNSTSLGASNSSHRPVILKSDSLPSSRSLKFINLGNKMVVSSRSSNNKDSVNGLESNETNVPKPKFIFKQNLVLKTNQVIQIPSTSPVYSVPTQDMDCKSIEDLKSGSRSIPSQNLDSRSISSQNLDSKSCPSSSILKKMSQKHDALSPFLLKIKEEALFNYETSKNKNEKENVIKEMKTLNIKNPELVYKKPKVKSESKKPKTKKKCPKEKKTKVKKELEDSDEDLVNITFEEWKSHLRKERQHGSIDEMLRSWVRVLPLFKSESHTVDFPRGAPWDPQTMKEFCQLALGTRRALEFCRAREVMEEMVRTSGLSGLWSVPRIIHWARRHGYTPSNSSRDFNALSKRLGTDDPIRTSSFFTEVNANHLAEASFSENRLRGSYDEPIIVVDTDETEEPTVKEVKKEIVESEGNEDSLLVATDLTEESRFIPNLVSRIRINFEPEEVVQGVKMDTARTVLWKACLCLMEDLVRCSFSQATALDIKVEENSQESSDIFDPIESLKVTEEPQRSRPIQIDPHHVMRGLMMGRPQFQIFTGFGLGKNKNTHPHLPP